MQFNSFVFAAFFAIVLVVYNLPAVGWRGQKIVTPAAEPGGPVGMMRGGGAWTS